MTSKTAMAAPLKGGQQKKSSPATLESREADARPPDDRRLSVSTMIETAVKRLEAVVDEETAALGASAAIDLKAFSERKSMGLIELNRAIRLLSGGKADPDVTRSLRALNAKLEANRQALRLHMEAVREIVAIIAHSIREAESDGTYTQTFRSKGGTR